MLKYKIEHIFGSQERHDLQLTRLTLDGYVRETEALENGWLMSDGTWYQCRSVRINVSQYQEKNPKAPLPAAFTVQQEYELGDHIKQVYEQYREYKKFGIEHDVFGDTDRCSWLVVYDEGTPVAFTKMLDYRWGVESQYTAWNYHKPKLSIGKKLLWYEVAYAAKCNHQHLYIGQGYESGSAYKADFAGFEWWTGSEWSTDKTLYRELCERDSAINTLEDLSKVYKEYGDRQEPNT